MHKVVLPKLGGVNVYDTGRGGAVVVHVAGADSGVEVRSMADVGICTTLN